MLKLAQLLNSSPFCLLSNLNCPKIPRTSVRLAMFSRLHSQNAGIFRYLIPVLSGFYVSFLLLKQRFTKNHGETPQKHIAYVLRFVFNRPQAGRATKQQRESCPASYEAPLFNNLDSAMWELLKGGSLVTETNERANRSGLYIRSVRWANTHEGNNMKNTWAYMDAATVAKNAVGIKHEERAAILVNANGASVQKLAAQLPDETAETLKELARAMMPQTQPERHYTNDAETQRLLQSLRACAVQEFIRTSRGEFGMADMYNKGKLANARVLTEVHGVPAAQIAEECAVAISNWRWEVSRAIREANRNG